MKFRRSLLKIALVFFVGAIAVAVLAGCTYTHIAWAKEWGVVYIVVPIPVSEWQRRIKKEGYPTFSIAAYLGEELGLHWIIVRGDWCGWNRTTGVYECNKFLVNHELKHARYPEWNHWMR